MRRILVILLALGFLFINNATFGKDTQFASVFQTGTLAGLIRGQYDGKMTFQLLKKKGGFGLGTVNGLDGEMLALDGVFYQITVDGRVHTLKDSARTPFAVVTFFKTDTRDSLSEHKDFQGLREHLERLLPNKDRFYAIKVKGHFPRMKTRSVPKQQAPYKGLLEVVKEQRIFELGDVHGTMVGFRFPEYMKGVNVPRYHFHFITRDRNAGGHVLGCTSGEVTIEVGKYANLSLRLPQTGLSKTH